MTQRLRVASVPSGHVYVRHLSADPAEPGDAVRLPDPRPGSNPDAPWWPPQMLEPAWVEDNADEFDLMHIHFGFDSLSPARLRELGAALRRHRKPLVLTIHDLRNPHHPEADLHEAQLDALVQSADALITLTGGASRVIEQRWDRTATVLPHPHVVPLPWIERPRPQHDGFVVGVHAKSLRANFDPLPVVDDILGVLPSIPGSRLRVDVHTDVMTSGFDRFAPQFATRLADLERQCKIELHVHDYFTDDELWGYLQGIDVSVLPYRFGTHSGWLEACHDLGTAVVAPDCGFYGEQRPCHLYSAEPARRPDTLRDALRRAAAVPPARATAADRRAERLALAAAHRSMYAAVLGRSLTCTS